MSLRARVLRENWEFNVLGIYDYRRPGALQGYFDFVAENHTHIPGDLLEAGVFRGRSLLGMALMLKELGSDKVIYGYDSWRGFPPVYHEADEFGQFERLYHSGRITADHFARVKLNQEYRALELKAKALNAANLSRSGDFSGCSQEELQAKIDFLGLDNVKLVGGPFETTMRPELFPTARLMGVLLDADLYASYKLTLPFVWPRLERGGLVFLDEYYSLKFPGARAATDEFFADRRDKPQRYKVVEGDFERWYVRKLYE